MSFVNRVGLKEFRGVRECERPLKLRKFTVLVGRNNSGKSSVLEALSLLPNPHLNVPLLGETRLSMLAGLLGGRSSIVYGYHGTARLEFELRGATISFEIDSSGNVLSRELGGLKYEPNEFRLRVKELFGLKDSGELEALTAFIPDDSKFLRSLGGAIVREDVWPLVEKAGANVSVVRDLVDRVVRDDYEHAFVGWGDLRLSKRLSDGRVLSIKAADVGDGVKRVLIAALMLEAVRPRLVLWDDIEAAAHPGLIEGLIEWLGSRDWQVVASTHSLDVIRALVDVRPPDCSILALNKDEGDVLDYRELSPDEVEDTLDRGLDVRKLLELL